MAIANALISGSKNTVKIYYKNFNNLLDYEIKLTKNVTCQEFVVSIDGVFFCDNYATFHFELLCIQKGDYNLEIFEVGNNTPIFSLSAIVY